MNNFFKKVSKKFDNAKPIPLINFYIFALLTILLTSLTTPHDKFQIYISMMKLGALIGAVITSFTTFKVNHDSMSITISKTSRLASIALACIPIVLFYNQKTIAYGLVPGIFLGEALLYNFKYIICKEC